jgi:TPR repeat protein
MAQPAAPEARTALVIGNGAYRTSPLKNPVQDAKAMAEALQKCGFRVTLLEDATRMRMVEALRAFGQTIQGGGVGLFYFAGHGLQVKGKNYLVPVDSDLASEDEVAYSTLDADAVLAKMETARNRLNILILDACRNNPFGSNARGFSQGLAQMDAPAGSYIAFATAPGRTAADGVGSHGLYTQYLLAQMAQPGLKVEDVFKRVRAGVMRDSKEQQVPWESSSITGDFYFVPGAASLANSAAVASPAAPVPVVPQIPPGIRALAPTPAEAKLLDAIRTESGGMAVNELAKPLAAKGSLYGQFALGWSSEDMRVSHLAVAKAVADGIPMAMVCLAEFLVDSPVSPEDLKEARNWLDKAIGLGETRAKLILGELLLKGKLGSKDVPAAERLFAEVAREYPPYYLIIGQFYWHAKGVKGEALPKEDAEAKGLAYWRRAAELGDGRAMWQLGISYLNGHNVPKDLDEGLRWYEMAAEHGDGQAMMDLGNFYASGGNDVGGVDLKFANGEKALHWYRLAAGKSQDSIAATLGMANMYRTGLAVPKDIPKALGLLRPLAEKGIPWAQLQMGSIFQHEEPKDLAQAYFWLTLGRSTDLAEYSLKKLDKELPAEERGRIVAKAAKWRQARAEKGSNIDQYCLGDMYESGVGVPKDASQAYFWYVLSGDRGWGSAIDRLADQLPAAERARVEAQAAKWKPKK